MSLRGHPAPLRYIQAGHLSLVYRPDQSLGRGFNASVHPCIDDEGGACALKVIDLCGLDPLNGQLMRADAVLGEVDMLQRLDAQQPCWGAQDSFKAFIVQPLRAGSLAQASMT